MVPQSRARRAPRGKACVKEQNPEQKADLLKLLTSELCPSFTAAALQTARSLPAPAPGGKAQSPQRRAFRGLNLSVSVSPISKAGPAWRCTPSLGSETSSLSARGACRATWTQPELSAPTLPQVPPPHHFLHQAPRAPAQSRLAATWTTSR